MVETTEKIPQVSSKPLTSQRRKIFPFFLQCCFFATCLVLAGAGLLYLPSQLSSVAARQAWIQDPIQAQESPQGNSRRVRLDVHIESMCPDARDCLQKLVVPAYWQVQDKVALGIYHVGELWKVPRSDVTCQHGWNECAGNKLLVCADELSNTDGDALGFASCVLSDYQRVSELGMIEECANEHGLNYEYIKKCANSNAGRELLTESVHHSVSVGANFSCTIRVNGEEWCRRDDYKWLCSEDHYSVSCLVKKIKELAGERHYEKTTD